MVHAKSLEEKFIRDGFGTERNLLMYNDFVIIGPEKDPAGIKGLKYATEAIRKISENGAAFISRGDKSGTHVAEMELWGKAGIKPSGAWYKIYEKGAEGKCPDPPLHGSAAGLYGDGQGDLSIDKVSNQACHSRRKE